MTSGDLNKPDVKKPTPVSHDAAFKALLTHPDTARDFIELHLSAELRAVWDLITLLLESGSDARPPHRVPPDALPHM